MDWDGVAADISDIEYRRLGGGRASFNGKDTACKVSAHKPA
jgi:hypothetical protein